MALSTLNKVVRVIKALRGLLMTLVLLVIAIPALLYVILSSDWAQRYLCSIAETELAKLLGTEVKIGAVNFAPFNYLSLENAIVHDDLDSVALTISSVDTRFEIMDFITSGKIIIDYATIEGLKLKLYKENNQAPLNIEGIIKKLQKKDSSNEETIFKLRINDVSLSQCALTYDVLSEPSTPGRFDTSHISLDSLDLNVFAPIISNDSYIFWIRKLSMRENSSLVLHNLAAKVTLEKDKITIDDLTIRFGNSLINFADFSSNLSTLQGLSRDGTEDKASIQIINGSHIRLSDLSPFIPILASADYDIDFSVTATGNLNTISIEDLRLTEVNDMVSVNLSGTINDFTSPETLSFNNVVLEAHTNHKAINTFLSYPDVKIKDREAEILKSLGNTCIKIKTDGTFNKGQSAASITSELASVNVEASYTRPDDSKSTHFKAHAQIDSAHMDIILPHKGLGTLSANLNAEGYYHNKQVTGHATADITNFVFKGYTYHDIELSGTLQNDVAIAKVDIEDPNIRLHAKADYDYSNKYHRLSANLEINDFQPEVLHLIEKYPGYVAKGKASLSAEGTSIDRLIAEANIDQFVFTDGNESTLRLNHLNLKANNLTSEGRITLVSDYLRGSVDGNYKFSTLKKAFINMFVKIVPIIEPFKNSPTLHHPSDYDDYNNFAFDFSLSNTDRLSEFFDIPVSIIDTSTLYGVFNESTGKAFLKFDVPWLLQGNNIIEGTSLSVDFDSSTKKGLLYLTTLIPTKKGNMDMVMTIKADGGVLHTNMDWSLVRAIPINGMIDFTTSFLHNDELGLVTRVDFNPGQINFGDEIWEIRSSSILYGKNLLTVRNFALDTGLQSIHIDGSAGTSDLDVISVELNNIQLINIFETLEIDNALISGQASGVIAVSSLFSKEPKIQCDHLSVKSIGYNYCTLGDADVRLNLTEGGGKFNFDADIVAPGGEQSYIDGYIEIPTESLDLQIKANSVKVGFMKPFMQAFTSDVDGFVSGDAHLYGTFKNIDLSGDVFARDLKIKIDFTNTWYYATDSVHIRPGRIDLKNIILKDEYGQTAELNGYVGHEFFHNATFDFNITNAHNFLCYDVDANLSPDWYGKIFGNGSATVKGKPGVVDIGARMTTAPNSTFTFVLSDRLDADEYQFITFRDVTPLPPARDSLLSRDLVPEKVKSIKSRGHGNDMEVPTAYNMDINVDITPAAQMILVMDPAGGDEIRANGYGNMRMTYASVDNDLRLFGTYTLDRGTYNFTLQDIIRRDFTIKPESSISFTGDPYNAKLNIEAYFQVNANLSDLDESFIQDKELNRTIVPVRALMKVNGSMLQPDIAFDLEFPTLSQDIYRKVRSIVSTEDMMNRQILYLLALTRFYTPDYMTTTKGNELFSVASSTLSSQLSSMLGKLSDNWSIAPNLRSDRGDFSDVEVDVTLSSSLLNNRLLFNGNLGYRDKSLNTNQFIGDFDLEYLLNRTGVWRLKAYNRYNDQNYYLRTAQTTQGVGILYRKDFDQPFRFLKKLWRNRKKTEPVDTIELQEHISVSDSTINEVEQISVIQ